MSHEYEHGRANSPAAAPTRNETAEPGQSSRSTLLRRPDHAIASGLAQRTARDANGAADGAEHAVAATSSSSGSSLPDTLMRKAEAMPALTQVVAQHTGETITDDGGFSYLVRVEGTFEIVATPAAYLRSLHQIIAPAGRYATAWNLLAQRLAASAHTTRPAGANEAAPPAAPARGSTTDIDGWTIVLQKVRSWFRIDEPKPVKEEQPKPEPEPKNDHVEQPAALAVTPAVTGDVRYCINAQAWIRDATGKQLRPQQRVPLHSYVHVLETTVVGATSLVRVAILPGNQEAGWIAASNLTDLLRARRPSSAAAQMAALLAAATTDARPAGRCYAAIKRHIKEAGGYGDILDPYADERFEGLGGSAVMFASVVAKYGAAALGLEEVGGLPKDAPPGTLLVTRGNDQINISKEHGDIAVISHVEKGCIVAYNDGRMKLIAAPNKWATDYQGVLVGMYKPIDRE